MKISRISVKGSNPWNEDALVIQENKLIFGVIDGATSLVPYRSPSGETGGLLASRLVAKCIETHDFPFLTGDPELKQTGSAYSDMTCVQLADALLAANTQLQEEMVNCGIDTSQKEQLWAASALLVHIRPTAIDYVQAGDCMLVAYYRDGTFRVITRDQLDFLDEETKRLWFQGYESGIESKEALWEYVKPQIANGRRMMNTKDGYAVLNGDPALADHLEMGTINRINLRALLLMTDGLYIPHMLNEPALGADEVAKRVARMGLDAYIDWLTQLEQSDAECVRYPRVKRSDDKTAIWIEFEH